MKRSFSARLVGTMLVSMLALATAQEEKEETNLEVSGFGYFMFGQIVSGVAGDVFSNEIAHYWQDFGVVNFTVTSKPNDWFTACAGLEMATYFPIQFAAMDKASYYIRFNGFIPKAEGIFHWNFSDLPLSSLVIESGLFQYTFNPEVTNLGNYLYRSRAVPVFLESKIDYPWANLMGVRNQLGLLEDQIKLEAILNTIYDYPPWYDWSLGFTASYAPQNKIIDVGAGICFDHLLAACQGTMSDTLQKNWKATKLDARAILDPKPLFGNPSIFGDKDCKIYGEVALLGLSDSIDTVQYYYMPEPSLKHRMPFLLGFNVPTMKVFDLFSVELEWFKSPWPNDWFGQFDINLPYPRAKDPFNSVQDSIEVDNYIHRDNFKWSFFLKRSISMFEFRAYIANDHSIYKTFKLENLSCFQQTLKRPKDWQWFVELRYNL